MQRKLNTIHGPLVFCRLTYQMKIYLHQPRLVAPLQIICSNEQL